MLKSTDQTCPHASTCWLGGAYNYCKTATCKEPLLPKDKVLKMTIAGFSGASIVGVNEIVDLDYKNMEKVIVEEKLSAITQGELF